VAEQLVRFGADVNVVDKDGKTPLMLAVVNGFQPLVELLLLNDADVSIKNEVGRPRTRHNCHESHSHSTCFAVFALETYDHM